MQFIDTLVCEAPGKLAVVQRSAPPSEEGHVLVRPLRVGICGTDFHIYEGKHPYLQYPRVMGHELAVEVVEAQEGVGFSSGDLCVVNPYLSCGHCIACRAGKPNCCVNISVLGVHQDGGMTGLLSLPVSSLVRAPGLTADECATVEFLSIGAHAIRRGSVTAGDRVLVVGAGPIGLGAALFARLTGAEVAVFDHDMERAAAANAIAGVTSIAASGDPSSAIGAHTGGDGFDVVLDATGNPRAMETGFEYVAHGGRYVLVSVVKGPLAFMDPDFHRKEMTLLGSRNATSEDFERVIAAIRAGKVPVDKIVTHRTSLVDAVENLPVWAVQKTGLIKALIEIG